MAANPPAQVPEAATTGSNHLALLRRELLILGIAVVGGLVVVPLLIWVVGNRILGPYTHGTDTSAGTGPARLLADFFDGLVHGSVIFWLVALGPLVLVTLARLLWALIRSSPRPAAPAAPAPAQRREPTLR